MRSKGTDAEKSPPDHGIWDGFRSAAIWVSVYRDGGRTRIREEGRFRPLGEVNALDNCIEIDIPFGKANFDVSSC